MTDEIKRMQQELAALGERMRQLEAGAGADKDLVPLKHARSVFGISEVTARRYVKKGLGVKRFGRLFLSRSKVEGSDQI
jgi:hypothetical protein